MSKIHYFQRYSSVENTVTNNTLQLFARIYDFSVNHASNFLTDLTEEAIEIGVEINQQEVIKSSVPDGSIIQRSLKVLIESKVDASVDKNQLVRHAASFSNESQKILLLLTKELNKAQELDINHAIKAQYPDVIFKNITYEMICSALKDRFKEHESSISAIVDDYIDYCNDLNLFDQSKSRMRIVPCGRSIELNKKYGLYFQPSDRGYSKHSYIGIYAQKSVQAIWKIDCVFDIEFSDNQLEKSLVQGESTSRYDRQIIDMIGEAKTQCGYEIARGARFFCGQRVTTNYKKTSSGGIQGARFLNLQEAVGLFTDVDDLARKLNAKTWT